MTIVLDKLVREKYYQDVVRIFGLYIKKLIDENNLRKKTLMNEHVDPVVKSMYHLVFYNCFKKK